ncbi:MAG: hypothetical protein PHZ00_01030 [Candidatus Peribacteraceae bacterium]|nr:hypothetical protein [Candidatus Peribacteraceae bacterium]
MNSVPDQEHIPKQVTARMAALESQLAPVFSNAPHLPPHVRTTIAEFAPWVALIVGIVGLLGIVPAFMAVMMSTFFVVSVPVVPMMAVNPVMIVSLLCGAVSSVLCLLAFRPLGKRLKKGWNLLFYSSTLSALSSVVSLIFVYSGFMGIVGAVIGYWLLFEVRELYRA